MRRLLLRLLRTDDVLSDDLEEAHAFIAHQEAQIQHLTDRTAELQRALAFAESLLFRKAPRG